MPTHEQPALPSAENAPASEPHAPPDAELILARRTTEAARALHAAGIIDLDAGLALLREDLAREAFDAVAAARQLKSGKPRLFAPLQDSAGPRHVPGATMSPAAPPADPRAQVLHAAQHAALAGDRGAVLTYMRLRRAALSAR